eukprot:gene469-877_t
MTIHAGFIREGGFIMWNLAKFCSLLHMTTTYVGNVTLCVGPSMIPTFKENGDLVFVDHFSHKILQRPFKQGDVVICICPYDAEKTICKRIAGLPGDTIAVKKEEFGYIRNTITTIPRGHVWLQGDNPSNSTDSRSYGSVPMGLLQGRVVLKLSPPQFISPEIPR